MSTKQTKRLRFNLRWKIMATIAFVAVAVLAVGFVVSYLAQQELRRAEFLKSHYARFEGFARGIGRATASSAAVAASDGELRASLSAGDRDASSAAVARLASAFGATSEPQLFLVVDRNGLPVRAAGTTALPASEISRSKLIADAKSGLAIQGELALIGGRAYQVASAAVRTEEGQVVGAVIVGDLLERLYAQFKEHSAKDPKRHQHLTLVDGRGAILASAFPARQHDEVASALQPSAWIKPEAEGDTPTVLLGGKPYDFHHEEEILGYEGDRYGDVGDVFLARTRMNVGEAEERTRNTVIVFLVALVISLFVGYLLALVITRRIDRYVEATEDLASGRGDLTRRLDAGGGDELGELAMNLNSVFAYIHELAAKVQRAAFQVGASSAEISAASKQMLEGAQEQARKTESSTAAVTELSASIQQVAENAMEATRVARASGDAVQKAIERMNEIRATVEEAAARIQDLGESGKRIGNIVEVIRQISDQTTLLALNAAIEAAHAGEQGRGFAVVADEVSQLAKRVGQSARDIEDLIATIKEQTVDAVRAMDSGVREVEEGTRLVNHTLGDLRTLVQVVEDTAKAVQEQALASDEIARNMDVVQRIAQDVLGSSEEAVEQGEHLHRLAHALEESVKGFRIDAGERPAIEARAPAALTAGDDTSARR